MIANENQIRIAFDMRVFGLTAIKKAAYRYIDRFSADIRTEGNEAICLLTFTVSLDVELSKSLIEDFRKEVLDQQLREEIKAETEPIRNLIFAHAFSKTELAQNEQISKD